MILQIEQGLNVLLLFLTITFTFFFFQKKIKFFNILCRDPKYDMPADPSPTTSNNNTYNNNNNTNNTNDTKDDVSQSCLHSKSHSPNLQQYLDTPEHSTPTTAFGSRTTFEVDSMLNNDAPTNDSPYSREPTAAAPTYGQTPVNPQYQQTPYVCRPPMRVVAMCVVRHCSCRAVFHLVCCCL